MAPTARGECPKPRPHFFLLERTARYLQDPFTNKPTDTRVTVISRTIEINPKQILRETNVPAPVAAEEYYLM